MVRETRSNNRRRNCDGRNRDRGLPMAETPPAYRSSTAPTRRLPEDTLWGDP